MVFRAAYEWINRQMKYNEINKLDNENKIKEIDIKKCW